MLLPAGKIVGLVRGAYDDRALSGVEVYMSPPIGDRANRMVGEAVTDTSGRFQISVADTDLYEIHARLIGYKTVSYNLRVAGPTGFDADIRIEVNPLRLCTLILTYPHSVAVRVVDSISGVPITVGASLEIIDGRYRAYANSGDPAPAGMSQDSSLLVAGDRIGNFEVIVKLAYHLKWTARHVKPTADECGMYAAGRTARMTPKH